MDAYEAQAAKKLHPALPDNPRAGIRPMEAVWFLIAAVLFGAHLESKSFPTEQAVRAEVRGCISQYGPGERWARTNPQKCAVMVEAPNHILSYPVGQ